MQAEIGQKEKKRQGAQKADKVAKIFYLSVAHFCFGSSLMKLFLGLVTSVLQVPRFVVLLHSS